MKTWSAFARVYLSFRLWYRECSSLSPFILSNEELRVAVKILIILHRGSVFRLPSATAGSITFSTSRTQFPSATPISRESSIAVTILGKDVLLNFRKIKKEVKRKKKYRYMQLHPVEIPILTIIKIYIKNPASFFTTSKYRFIISATILNKGFTCFIIVSFLISSADEARHDEPIFLFLFNFFFFF